MSAAEVVRPRLRDLLWRRTQDAAAYGGTLAAAIFAVGGLFSDVLSLGLRIVLVIVAVGLAIIGILGVRKRGRRETSETIRADRAEVEAKKLRLQLERSAPEAVLEITGAALFVRPGAWRLTLFVVEQGEDGSWRLNPLVTRASSEVIERARHVLLPLRESRLREVLDVDATDPLQPFSNLSANLPDRELEFDEWRRLRAQLIPSPDDLGMPTRKFGWTVTIEPASRRTLVLLSESVLSDGIQLDASKSQLIGPVIALIARMHGVAPLAESS